MTPQSVLGLIGQALAMAPLEGNLTIWEDEKKDPTSGGHRKSGSTSLAAILATFVPTFTTAVIYVVIFLFIREKYRNIYAPRTYMSTVPEKDRTPSSRRSDRANFRWIHDFWRLDDRFVLRHQSLDGYLFLRFFRTIALMCFVGCCITWPILFPVNALGGGSASQLDRISFSNIKGSKRLYAHAVVAWAFLGFIMILVARERMFVVGLRQAHLLTKSNAQRLSSKVVLFLSVPAEAAKDENLHRMFGAEAKRSWLVSKLDKLESLVQDRNDKATDLETAEVDLIRNANKKSRQQNHKGSNSNRNGSGNGSPNGSIEDQSRPKHKSPMLIGKEIDTIEELRTVLPELETKVQKTRDAEKGKNYNHTTAIFVEYSSQAAAHQAYQQVQHPAPLRMQPRFVGVQPKEVLWSNLTLHPSDRIFRAYLAIAFIVATIILWSIPIGIVALISNIDYLTDKIKFLRFINNLPDPVLGFLKGFIPPYLMSEFISYVPKFFLYIAKLSGEATLPQATMRTQTWYFAFQVIQVFLITTFASGAASVATQIANSPTSVPTLLAQNLPTASNFYLAYFTIQGTASAASTVLNYSDLLEYLAYDKLFDRTPRQQYARYTQMKGISWGKMYPKFTNFAVIAIAYSCIAPLMLGFAAAGLYLFYLGYRYNMMYVIQTKVDTKGECYSRALQHILTGVYLSELCLIGLFGAKEATGPSILIIILFVVTVIYHITFNRIVGPLERNIPISILDEDEEGEDAPLLAAEEDTADPASRVLKLGSRAKLPPSLLSPLAKFLEPHIFESHQHLMPWLHDPQNDAHDDTPSYSDDELKNAYVNPALTSKMAKLWLVRDEMGVSKREIEGLEKIGVGATDDGASLDGKGAIVWDHVDLENVPVFKKAKVW